MSYKDYAIFLGEGSLKYNIAQGEGEGGEGKSRPTKKGSYDFSTLP